MAVWGVDIGTGGGGGFAPSDVAGLWGWWKADALGLANDAAVSSWTDSSGNSRHLTQATGSAQPTYKTNILNSKAIVRFDGNDVLTILQGAGGTNLSVFAVARTTIAGTQLIIGTRNVGTGWILRVTATGLLYASIGATPNATDSFTVANTWVLYEIVRTGTSAVPGHDGTMGSAVSQSALPPASARTDMGAEASTVTDSPNQNWFNGDIAEVILYDAAVSGTDRDSIEAYIASKYALTIA